MSWRHLDGPELTVQVTNGTPTVSAGDPVEYSSDTVIAATNGGEVAGVMHEDGAASETGLEMDILVPGSVWEVTVSSQDPDLNRGVLVYMGASSNVDEGSAGNIAIGRVINVKITDASTTAQIFIIGGRYAYPS